MVKLYNEKKYFKVLINVLFVISGISMTALLSQRGSALSVLIGVICSLIIFCLLCFKYNFLDYIFGKTNKIVLFISILFCILVTYNLMEDCFNANILKISNSGLYSVILSILSYFSIIIFFSWFLNWFISISKEFFVSSDKVEKNYLIYFSIFMFFAVIIIYNNTDVFYALKNSRGYDIVYTSDSGMLVSTDVFSKINAPENDIRQPLFGLFALPFSTLAKVIANELSFIPNIYFILVNIIQTFLLQVSMILICRMLKLTSVNKLIFLTVVSFSYPFMLFSLNMEQYIFPVFWLILFIYAYIFDKNNKDYYFIGATGSLLTSCVIFPLLSNFKTLKDSVKIIIGTLLKFFAFIIVFGQLQLFLNAVNTIKGLMYFAGAKLTFMDKLLQFINFVGSCFIKPETHIITDAYATSYQLLPVTSVSIVGIIILAFAILGFILGREDKFTKVCFGWVIYSFVLLCIIGWGTSENGLILYTLYFSWAYISLIYIAIDKIFDKIKPIKYVIFSGLIITLLVFNLSGIYDLIKFGFNYYPIAR